ncbi:FAD-dependent oxidoreductase [Pseudonocardia sp. TRM90224]|uniref:FAD-dependent oxidoreductase n=1 Tax=Pseudonocardia sp. TRM90224 TaxID=2812678 RepID=UPI001E629C7A|nr:FAD-dependent oxidoreductase [Pseudonocardia sp. TRM90224]
MTDVVVVGGGAVGAAAAWQLAARGVEVLLVERFAPGHTRGASHGKARTYRPGSADPAVAALADESFALWRDLESATGADLLHLTGGVDHGDPDVVAARAGALAARGLRHEWLTARDAEERWPGMRFQGRVLHQPDRTGRINADHAVAALTAAAVGEGALVRHRTRVTDIVVQGPDAVDVVTDQDVVRARKVVIAAGAWTAELVGGTVDLPQLQVVRDELAVFPVLGATPCGGCPVQWPAFVHHREGAAPIAGLAAPEGVRAGVDGPDGADLVELQRYVQDWLPGADPTHPTPVSSAYTTAVDGPFLTQRSGPVVVGVGSSTHGFSFVPALGRVLADLAVGAPVRRAAAG